jgi:hypothetical protein
VAICSYGLVLSSVGLGFENLTLAVTTDSALSGAWKSEALATLMQVKMKRVTVIWRGKMTVGGRSTVQYNTVRPVTTAGTGGHAYIQYKFLLEIASNSGD